VHRRTISRLLAAAFFLPAVLAVARPACAGDAPDWLRSATHQPAGQYPPETKAVTLLDEEVITVRPNGESEMLVRRAIRILRPGGEEQGVIVVPFSKEMRISSLNAWSITAAGVETSVKEKEAVEVTYFEYELYADYRYKGIRVPGSLPGSVIGYEYSQKLPPYRLEEDWYFQSGNPLVQGRFTLQLPAGWSAHSLWANYPEQKAQESGGQLSWNVSGVPALEEERDMPPWQAIAGHMLVRYFPLQPTPGVLNMASWKDIGDWYTTLIAPRRIPTPEIKAKAAELTSGLTDPLAKISALATFAQRDIRYVAIEIGLGGYQPHGAGDVLAQRYGDCKDKTTLLSSLLSASGIDSYYVVINSRRGIARPDFPLLESFNHVIIAIHLPDAVPDGGALYSVIQHPTLGRLLLFDPTDYLIPLGILTSDLQDSYALLVTPTGGESIKTPMLPPSTNRLMRTAKFSLNGTGALSGSVTEIRWGDLAAQSRGQFEGVKEPDRPKIFEAFLGRFLNGFSFHGGSVQNLDNISENLLLQYAFSAPDYAASTGNLLLVRPRVLGYKSWDILSGKPRHFPIEFNGTTFQTDDFQIDIPLGYVIDELPPPTTLSNSYASYHAEVKAEAGALHYTRSYEVKQDFVPVSDLPVMKKFFDSVAGDERNTVVLRQATP
jgi:hypothetical protein